MARIKELQEKKAKEALTAEEEAELKSLLAEAKGDDADIEADVDALASKLVEAVESKNAETNDKLDKIMKAFEDQEATVKSGDAPVVIIDKTLGNKTLDELSEIKTVVSSRKLAGKEFTELSAKSGLFIKALIESDREKLQLLTEGTGSAGGFLVPEEFANMIVEDRRDMTVMRQIADVHTTQSDTYHLPSLATRPKAAWRGEAAVKNTSTVQFVENVFTPYSLAVIVGLSNELEADATLGVSGNIAGYVANLMARSISEEEDKAFFVGSGTGQPTGLTQYTVGTLASGSTDEERADSIQKTFRRLGQGYRNSAVWVANSQTWEKIDTLKDTNGQYLLRGLADSPTPVLKGRPVYEQNDLPAGTLYFGDFSFYKIVDREGIRVDISREATVAGSSAFEKNLTFVRVEERTDGELALTGAIRSATGMGS